MSIPRIARYAAIGLGLLAGSANASFHQMKVVEVFPGAAAAPNAQYVNIQMYTDGQKFVSGHHITVFGPTGLTIQTFTFAAGVANGINQDKILIATPEAVAFFGLSADLSMTAVIPPAGGKVCFDALPEDCVAWGNYSGSATGVGTPFNASTGLQFGKAAIRRLDIAPAPPGSDTALEALDDTDNCATDFVTGSPSPRNNARVNGTIPGSTCQNSIIEGLEECDDGNAANGDGCSSLCLLEPPPPNVIFMDGFE